MDLGNYFGQLGNLGNWIWAICVKHTLQINLTKTITLNANTQEIIKEFMTYLIKTVTLNTNTKQIITLTAVCDLT